MYVHHDWTETDLYPAVTPVGYNDVSIGVHSHTSRSIELAIAFSMRTKFEQEFAVRVVNLEQFKLHTLASSQCALSYTS